jgi:hypothetical protein
MANKQLMGNCIRKPNIRKYRQRKYRQVMGTMGEHTDERGERKEGYCYKTIKYC